MKYDMKLTDWISVSLHRKSLDEIVNKIRSGEPINFGKNIEREENRRYIEKIMREEVIKQFSDIKRPMLEVVLNAIDAKPKGLDEDYVIDIHANSNKFWVIDNGTGMSIEEILRLLIIPFSTEKDGISEIGRFGVGFLSTFNYCLLNPYTGKVFVQTDNGKEAHDLTFYSTSESVTDLHMKVKRRKPKKRGTTVLIKRAYDKKEAAGYIGGHLKTIPSYVVKIGINGEQLNNDGSKWYSVPVKLKISEKEITQESGLQIREFVIGADSKYQIQLTAQGVFVKGFSSESFIATASFPPAIRLVEGRDNFKIDENYDACSRSFFIALEKFINESVIDERFVYKMTNFIPSLLSALGMTKITDIQNIKTITDKILKDKKYVMFRNIFPEYYEFLGEPFKKLVFQASPTAYNYWNGIYRPQEDAVTDFLKPVRILSVSDFYKAVLPDNSIYRNLHLLAYKIDKKHHSTIYFVEQDPNARRCLFAKNDALFVNVNHRYVTGEFSELKVYAIISEYFHDPKVMPLHDIKHDEEAEKRITNTLHELTDGPKIIKHNDGTSYDYHDEGWGNAKKKWGE